MPPMRVRNPGDHVAQMRLGQPLRRAPAQHPVALYAAAGHHDGGAAAVRLRGEQEPRQRLARRVLGEPVQVEAWLRPLAPAGEPTQPAGLQRFLRPGLHGGRRGLRRLYRRRRNRNARSGLALVGRPVALWIYLADVDAAYRRAADAGLKTAMPPTDMFWGDRIATLTDRWGNAWMLAQHMKDLTPAEMKQAEAAFLANMKK